MRKVQYNPADLPKAVRETIQSLPDLLTITTPDTVGQELEIPHGLGHTPSGIMVLDKPYSWLNWGRGDTEWDARFLYLKFSIASETLTIAVV